MIKQFRLYLLYSLISLLPAASAWAGGAVCGLRLCAASPLEHGRDRILAPLVWTCARRKLASPRGTNTQTHKQIKQMFA